MRGQIVLPFAVLALIGASVSMGSTGTSRTVVRVTPSDALIDRRVSIVVSGLRPGQQTTVSATTTDGYGHRWVSSATFRADANGHVALAHSPALAGSYRGIDPMGLFWSMHEVGTKTPRDQQAQRLPFVSTATVKDDGAKTTITRRWRLPGVTLHRTTVAHDGFVGCYWAPPSTKHRMPAVLFFGGSEGGLPCYQGVLLASHGYPELDLAYFGAKGLPAQLERIPLEYFRRALVWLAKQPGVDPQRLVTWGVSRGVEASLLLGTNYPSLVHGVVGYVGDNVVGTGPHGNYPAWTVHGKAIPIGSQIPVERVNGPLFLVGAWNDSLGLSASDVENMAARLRAHHRHDFTALTYPNAGHAIGFGIPNVSDGDTLLHFGVPVPLGGTIAGDAHAREDSWPKLLAFLARLRASS